MDDFIEVNKSWFLKKYQEKLKKRYWTFSISLNLFLQNHGKVIIETGCIRGKNDWGAGNSTYVLGEFCKEYGRQLISVDNSPVNIAIAEELTKEFHTNINFEESDSIEFLKNYDGKIDLLYLDSLDCKTEPNDCNVEAQEHALNELKAAYAKLEKHAIVLIDDNLFKNGGKTRLCKEWLEKKGWCCAMDYKQTLWFR